MKGQFLVISSIVIGVILLGTAGMVAEVRSENFDSTNPATELEELKYHASQMDLSEEENREALEYLISSSSYDSEIDYSSSTGCVNVTLRTDYGEYLIDCIQDESTGPTFTMVLEAVTGTEFDSAGAYNVTTVDVPSQAGDVVLGYQDGTSGDSLLGYWRLDGGSGDVMDYSGEGNDGDNYGAERGEDGILNTSAFDFPEESDVVKVPHSSDLGGMSELTVSAWIKEKGNPPSNYAHTVSKSGESVDSGNNDWGIVQQADRDVVFRVNTDNGDYDDTNANAGPPPRGEWLHVVGTWDGSNIRIYTDGTLEDTQSQDGDIKNAGDPLGIGRHADNTNERYFNGSIDEVRIYDRQLTTAEVRQLYFYGRTSPYEGEYNVSDVSIPSGETLEKLEVSSVTSSETPVEVTVDHDSGGSDTVALDTGSSYRNYSLGLSATGGQADIQVRMTTTNVNVTPVLRSMRLWSQ